MRYLKNLNRAQKRLVSLSQRNPKDGGDYACGPVVVVRVELGDKNQNSCYINTKDHNHGLHLDEREILQYRAFEKGRDRARAKLTAGK